ncbi:hypothetical protein LMG18090_04607 [Ralstonia mannitolilytica]|nr:hypothetical protein LMG18090_04607 [Ralstonia mannitolilytica]CAJ0886415.1 hypothetical protein R76727_03838 [Ralstonia mannitolilytica]
MLREVWRGHPAKRLLHQHIAVGAPIVVAQHDRGVQAAVVEGLEDLPGAGNADLQRQRRFGQPHLAQQARQLRANDVVADADRQPPPFHPKRPKRAFVRCNELARRAQEGSPILR